MDLSFLLRGLIIGFSIAAPVGPIYKFAYWFYMAIICVFEEHCILVGGDIFETCFY